MFKFLLYSFSKSMNGYNMIYLEMKPWSPILTNPGSLHSKKKMLIYGCLFEKKVTANSGCTTECYGIFRTNIYFILIFQVFYKRLGSVFSGSELDLLYHTVWTQSGSKKYTTSCINKQAHRSAFLIRLIDLNKDEVGTL